MLATAPTLTKPMTMLPSFKAPPVTEVVIGARFKPTDYDVVAIGQLGAELRDIGFDRVQERPGYDAPTERFGASSMANSVSLELLTGSPPNRYWFLNAAGDELLQLQPDWLAANWRKVTPEALYGRWDSRWDSFSAWVDRVENSLAAPNGLEFDQVEVSYINHIEPADVWTNHGDVSSVFSFIDATNSSFLPMPEQLRSDSQYVMAHDGEPVGRLHVTVVPGFRRSIDDPVFVMTLTARGRPVGTGREGVRQFANLAHEWIVRGFADLTTVAMHDVWQREDIQTKGEPS